MATRTKGSMTRRRFTSLVGATIGATLAGRGNHAAADEPAESGYVDIHTHLGQTWNYTQYLSVEELLRWMDAHRVHRAAVLPLVSPEASSYPWSSRFVLEQTKPF